MSKFYLLQQSLDPKIVGSSYPQGAIRFTKESELIGDRWIDYIYKSEKLPNALPNISVFFAYHAKWTDILNINGLPSSWVLPISDRFLEIILSFDLPPHQYWRGIRVRKKNAEKKYNLFYCYENSLELLDYKKCSFYFSYLTTPIMPVKISSATEYLSYINRIRKGEFQDLKTKKGMKVSNVACPYLFFKKAIPFDFFKIQGPGVTGNYISERLKIEIETAGCTGINFLPIEKAEYLIFDSF